MDWYSPIIQLIFSQVFHEVEGIKVVDLTEETFQKTIDEHRVAIIDFFAPWCVPSNLSFFLNLAGE